jgi:hypothetical protein
MADGRPCVPNEFGLWRPSADGWPARRMNSASRGLRPTVGLRRPGRCLLRRRRPTPGAQRLGRPISIGVGAFGRWSACADRRDGLCVGGGRRLAWRVPNEFGLGRPSAGGRPAPTEGIAFALAEADAWRGGCRMNSACGGLRPMVGLRRPGRGFASAEADAWRGAPLKADFNRRGGLRPCVPNEFGLWGPSAGGRPAPTEGIAFASAEADAWRASASGRPISIGVEAFGRRLACADREVSFASAEADAWRASASEGRFQSAWRPSADGWPAPTGRVSFALAEADAWRGGCRMNSACGGLRPAVGLRRPGGCLLRWRRPTPGAEGAE